MANLRIFQWNARNFHTNLDQFKQFFDKNTCNIICLQSVNRKACDLPVLDGFYYPPYYKLNQNNHVSVATYINSNLVVKCVKPPLDDNDSLSVAIELTINDKPFTVINCYYPEGVGNKTTTEWISKLDNHNEQILIVGDFNAHHNLWSNRSVEPRRGGQHLSTHIIESSLVLLNDGSFTRLPERATDSSTAIDLSLVSSCLAPVCQWLLQDDTLGSDHLPIIIQIQSNDIKELEHDLEVGFDTNKADWSLFQSILIEKMSNITISENDSIQFQYDQFRQIILQAAEISIPKKCNEYRARYGNKWWNDECAVAVTNKRKAYHYYKRNENDETLANFKKAKYECKRIIAQAKIKYLENYIENNILSFKDSCKLWKKIKRLKNRYHLPEQPLISQGIKTNSNLEKANILADTFAKNSQSIFLPEEIRSFRKDKELSVEPPVSLQSDSPMNVSFSKTELMITIKQIKHVKKSTGCDLISYDMIKHFPNSAIEYLLKIFNACYVKGQIPNQWTEAEVIALPKKGKKHSDPNNYRPISLTPHLGKVYERLVKNRLEYHFQKNASIPSNQAGFKRGRGCSDHFVKLSSNIKKSMSKGNPVLAVFFDIRKAFDSVWIEKVLQKLHKKGIDGYMYHAVKCLITNRSFYVKIGSTKSNTHMLDMGVPQGSVISPLIFNLMLSDINDISLTNCKMTLYADDLTIWMTPQKFKNLYKSKACMCVRNRLQENVNKILEYMKITGFQLSAEKTTLIVFTGRHKKNNNDLYIKVNNAKIYPSSKAKYLGVIFDDRLNWKCHIEELIKKTNSIWNILKSLQSTPGGKHIPSLLKVIKSLVRSKLTYGQEAYFSANNNILKKLQTKECEFLRYALGLARGTPQSLVYREAGWLPLDKERELRCSQYFYRSKLIKNSTNEELESSYDNAFFNQHQPPPLNNRNSIQQCKPFYHYVHDLIETSALENIKLNKQQISPIPPWLLYKCSLDYEYANQYTKENDQLFISTLAKERIHEHYNNHLHIFTDGSKLIDGKVGGAFYIPDFKMKRQFRLNDDISVYSAELFSIYMALSFINDINRTLTQVVIMTDSKSVLQSLENDFSKNRCDLLLECKVLIHQILNKGVNLSLLWIPSHVGIHGNEVVDMEAKHAAQKPNIDYDIGFSITEIYSKLKSNIHVKWENQFQGQRSERNWINLKFTEYPQIPNYLQPLFHRLHALHLHNHYRKLKCLCNSDLTFHHIFVCEKLIPTFDQLNEMLKNLNITPTPQNLLSRNETYNWKLTETFLKCLFNSDIGRYI